MKRFKILLVAFVVSLLCLSMSGCAQNGRAVADSLEYDFYVYDSLQQVACSYSFEVTMPSSVNYEVEYTLTVYKYTDELSRETVTKTVAPNKDGKRTINDYFYCKYTAGDTESIFSLRITNIKVTPKKQEDKYKNYAIGFGTAGGAVLIACTALFIVLKRKEKKQVG